MDELLLWPAGVKGTVKCLGVFGAEVVSVAVRSCSDVSKVRVSPKCGIYDSVEGMLMGPDVNFKGLSLVRCLLATEGVMKGQAFDTLKCSGVLLMCISFLSSLG